MYPYIVESLEHFLYKKDKICPNRIPILCSEKRKKNQNYITVQK